MQRQNGMTEPHLIRRIKGSGLIIYTPGAGDQCWDAPFPCTRYFRSELRLRGKSLSEDFYLDESAGRAPDFGSVASDVQHR